MIAGRFRFHGYGSLRFVYKNGRAARSRLMTIKTTENPRRRNPRLSVVVSKKVIKSAVARNRIRRRVYECFRQEMPLLVPNSDIVCIISSADVRGLEAGLLRADITSLLEESGLYNQSAKNATLKGE